MLAVLVAFTPLDRKNSSVFPTKFEPGSYLKVFWIEKKEEIDKTQYSSNLQFFVFQFNLNHLSMHIKEITFRVRSGGTQVSELKGYQPFLNGL